MKVSLNWLSCWVPIEQDVPTLCHMLTMAGLEVDGYESTSEGLEGVIVGYVEKCEPHPNADKLSVCEVSHGTGDNKTVVCGAPNVAKGQRVAYAQPGAVLPNGLKLKVAKLRGVESHGMLCSAAELGIGEGADGIIILPADAPLGSSLIDYLNLDDHIIDIDLTPNRGDCLSVLGIARELAALTDKPTPAVDVPVIAKRCDDVFPVELAAPAACARYAGRVIKGVKADAESPIWLTETLRRAGVRSISPVVDITNYVMLELGQPMHAFDLDKLEGGIRVRHAEAGESLSLLDGQEIALNENTLVIADHSKAIALAGIMGGEITGVHSETQDILLESAFFDPISLAGVARHFRLHTDASHRFERGVDYVGQQRAIERATALVLEICGGNPGPIEVAESSGDLPKRSHISFNPNIVEEVLGVTIPDDTVASMLGRLGCEIDASGEFWQVLPPSYRFDLNIPVDLVEEVARLYGYENLDTTMPAGRMVLDEGQPQRDKIAEIKRYLIDNGYFEAITYSFIDESLFADMAAGASPLKLENPISSDMVAMRASTLPGLLSALKYNLNRQHRDVRLFEVGSVFNYAESGLSQPLKLGIVASGDRFAEHWDSRQENLDYFDLKHIVESIISSITLDSVETSPCEDPNFHPGQSVCYSIGGERLATAGLLHPKLTQKLGFRQPPLAIEIDLERSLKKPVAAFQPISKFPKVRRDISVVVAESISAEALLVACKEAAGELLRDLQLFDVFRGQGIDSDEKSLALGLIFQTSSRTLTEDEIETSVQCVLTRLSKDFDATLRE